MSPLRVLFAALVLACASATHAQEAQRNLYSTDNFVRTAALAGDTLYVGGDFSTLGPPTGLAGAVDKVTGEAYLEQDRIGTRDALSGRARVIISDGEGGWYVGGRTHWAGGEPRLNLAHILPNGRVNPNFAPDPETGPGNWEQVNVLLLADGVLYVGGRFDEIAGEPRQNLAAFDTETGALLPLSITMMYDGSYPRGGLSAVVHKDGVLYVGGDFLTFNGVPRGGAAAINAATGALLPWDPRLTGPPTETPGAYSLGIGPPPGDTTLYIGGLFDKVRGLDRRVGSIISIAEGSAEVSLADPVTGQGGVPTPWTTEGRIGGNPMIVTETDIRGWFSKVGRERGELTVFPLSNRYSYGGGIAFDPTGGPSGEGVVYQSPVKNASPYPAQYLVAYDAETGQLLPDYFDGGEQRVAKYRSGSGIISLAVEPGPEGRLLVAGDELYSFGPGKPRRFIAGIDMTTGKPTPFGRDYIIFSSVESMTASPDGRHLYFLTFNGTGIADLETGVISDFPLGGGLARAARQREHPEAGEAAGPIRREGPVVARADGSPAPSFVPPLPEARVAAPDPGPRVISNNSRFVVTDERLYFHGGGGVGAYDRFTGTEIWATFFNAFIGFPDWDDLLLIQAGAPGPAGDTLFASGTMYRAEGLPREKFVALDAETGAVLDWNVNPTEPGNGQGEAVAVLGPPGGDRVYLSGSFNTIGGVPRDDLAAASRTTGAVLDWQADPAVEFPGSTALAAQPGPGGGVPGGVLYDGEKAFDAETGALLAWDVDLTGGGGFGGAPSTVLFSERHGRVIVTGSFSNSLRGSGHAFVTALSPARPFAGSGPDLALTATASQTTVAPGGTVRFDYTLTNDADAPATGDLFFTAQRGQTTIAQGLIRSGTVPAGSSVSGSYTQRVPQNAPTGSYSYMLSAGRFPDLAVASESFAMTVTGDVIGTAGTADREAEWSVEDVTPWEADGATLEASSRAEALGAFPNPFSGRTAIRFEVSASGPVRLAVYDVLGREVAVLADGRVEAGRHEATFDARGLASGVYVWRLVAGERVETGRVTLVR